MAQLNLSPVPTVVAIQIGVFIVNMMIVKKLFLDPYMRLRAKRDALTSGSKADASRLLYECDEIARKVQDSIDSAASVAASERERIKTAAAKKRAEIIHAAELKAKAEFEAVSSSINEELAEQRRLLPKVITSLTDELFALTTNKH
jgi:F0F1-type ATP synthase membrane subunit b/b'